MAYGERRARHLPARATIELSDSDICNVIRAERADATKERDIELVRLRDQHDVMLAALKAAAPHLPVQIQAQVISAINLAALKK